MYRAATILSFLTICAWLGAAQGQHEIILPDSNFARFLPVLTVSGTKLFVAYRTARAFERNDTLEVCSYDLTNYSEIRHVKVKVPPVRGPRAADGLYLVDDRLFYAELHSPTILLALSAEDLTEVGRTQSLPFRAGDRQVSFVGPDINGILAFAEFVHGGSGDGGVLMLRVSPRDLRVVSSKTVSEVGRQGIERMLWNARSGRLWIYSGLTWTEFTEDGQATGRKVTNKHYITNGAQAIEGGGALGFFGNRQDGMLQRLDADGAGLPLDCSPLPWGISNSGSFAGVMCVKQSTDKFENGGNRILSSEFLLVRTAAPAIVWRHPLTFLDVSDGQGRGYQRGIPAIATTGSTLQVVTPAKRSRLVVYEISADK